MLPGDDRVECLANAVIFWMGAQAEAQARPVPQGLLSAPDHRLDLGPGDYVGHRVSGRPKPGEPIGNGLPDPPAELGKSVG